MARSLVAAVWAGEGSGAHAHTQCTNDDMSELPLLRETRILHKWHDITTAIRIYNAYICQTESGSPEPHTECAILEANHLAALIAVRPGAGLRR